jgi:hypothetical protein
MQSQCRLCHDTCNAPIVLCKVCTRYEKNKRGRPFIIKNKEIEFCPLLCVRCGSTDLEHYIPNQKTRAPRCYDCYLDIQKREERSLYTECHFCHNKRKCCKWKTFYSCAPCEMDKADSYRKLFAQLCAKHTEENANLTSADYFSLFILHDDDDK